MARVYRVAIIGTGRMGGLIEDEIPEGSFSKPYGHFSAYQAIEQTEVVAVANRGAERLARFARRFGVTNTYLDYRQMIDRERPDMVSITTPSFARAEPLIYCAEHGVRGIYAERRRFVPPPGEVYASPYPAFFRVGYRGGAEASFVPYGRFDVDVIGAAGRAAAWDNGQLFRTWRPTKGDTPAHEATYRPEGESPTVCIIRDIIREIETGERTAGN